MKLSTCIFIILGLTVLSGAASGAMTITSDKPWIVANNVDNCTIQISISPYDPANPINVTFSLAPDSTATGSFTSANPVVTNGGGTASVTFRAATKSGTANISAVAVYHYTGVPYTNGNIIQNVDHNAPTKISQVLYQDPAKAGSIDQILIRMNDTYDNIVDNRRETAEGKTAERVNFLAGSINGGAYFGTPGVVSTNSYVNQSGYAVAALTLDTMAGANWVRVTPPSPISFFLIPITGIGSNPVTINQTYNPSGVPYPQLPADGSSVFVITYVLRDRWGNPSPDSPILITTSMGEAENITTNSLGQAIINYGPKYSIGPITITARALDNSSVTCNQTVIFVSTDPVSMLLTASPQTMPSLDVNGTTTADVMAKVIDISGNPVAGETVNFQILPATYPPCQSQPPSLSAASAVTNADGFAYVTFIPGRFVTSGANYTAQATANCSVRATWGTDTGSIRLTWMNYPYLSVDTMVYPPTVPVNGTVNVTVSLKGDGWALQQKPVDVVLVIDRSGSMDRAGNEVDDGSGHMIDRIDAAKNSANIFVNQMTEGKDRVSVYSFSYETSVTRDAALGATWSTVHSKINALNADGATALRPAIKQAIDHLNANRRANSVRAIIVMTDGNWNNAGSPLAYGKGFDDDGSHYYSRDAGASGGVTKGFSDLAVDYEEEDYRWYAGLNGTFLTNQNVRVMNYPDSYDESTGVKTKSRSLTSRTGVKYCNNGQFTNQNMSIFAKNSEIKLYAISFAQNIPGAERNNLTILANGTGGLYYHAPTSTSLTQIYTQIAGALKTEAGVNTTMDLAFSNITVNNVTVPGATVFDYVYTPGISTYETSFNMTMNPINPPWPKSYDSTADWADNHNLHFDIGTIRINQTWVVTFQLKVKKEGNINIFGNGSMITFNNGVASLKLPDTYITGVAALNTTATPQSSLVIERPPGLVNTNNATMVEFMDLAWWVTYVGAFTYNETLTYEFQDPATWIWGTPVTIEKFGPKTNGTWVNETSKLDIRTLPHGIYRIKVKAESWNGPSDEANITISIGDSKSYIKLK